ncbi:MAG TPA: GIY-YIG nuclease family protein [Acidobacteriota bacterium]|nr:GIY-YIG nuclease family protein [Acidobacteriota bacterium]
MWFIYVIESVNAGRRYVGITTNIEKRIASHNRGKTPSTKAYLPWNLIYQEQAKDKSEAAERERFLKSGKGRDFLKSIA